MTPSSIARALPSDCGVEGWGGGGGGGLHGSLNQSPMAENTGTSCVSSVAGV